MKRPSFSLTLPEGTKWSKTNILEGFHKFIKENNRLPTAHEIDALPYLPSSRQIQRRFGGLQSLRKELGFDVVSFTQGEARRAIAIEINKKGHEFEYILEQPLIKRFGAAFVHTEKSFSANNNDHRNIIRVDFYIYAINGNFAIDIFHCKDKFSLVGSINHKIKVYSALNRKIYLVLYSSEYSQEDIDAILARKRVVIPKNIEVVTYQNFLERKISLWEPYPALETLYSAYLESNLVNKNDNHSQA